MLIDQFPRLLKILILGIFQVYIPAPQPLTAGVCFGKDRMRNGFEAIEDLLRAYLRNLNPPQAGKGLEHLYSPRHPAPYIVSVTLRMLRGSSGLYPFARVR